MKVTMNNTVGLGEYTDQDLIQELINRKALDLEDLRILKHYIKED